MKPLIFWTTFAALNFGKLRATSAESQNVRTEAGSAGDGDCTVDQVREDTVICSPSIFAYHITTLRSLSQLGRILLVAKPVGKLYSLGCTRTMGPQLQNVRKCAALRRPRYGFLSTMLASPEKCWYVVFLGAVFVLLLNCVFRHQCRKITYAVDNVTVKSVEQADTVQCDQMLDSQGKSHEDITTYTHNCPATRPCPQASQKSKHTKVCAQYTW